MYEFYLVHVCANAIFANRQIGTTSYTYIHSGEMARIVPYVCEQLEKNMKEVYSDTDVHYVITNLNITPDYDGSLRAAWEKSQNENTVK